jgi:hypothetical protein
LPITWLRAEISLKIFFSAFEELRLQTFGAMECNGIHNVVHNPSPVPTLYVEMVEDLLGRVSLIHSWTEMQPLQFHMSTAADRRTLLSVAVSMVHSLRRGGAAMFTTFT